MDKSALRAARKAAESLYDGICTISGFAPDEGIINDVKPVVVAENIPCRLSYKNLPNASQTQTGAVLTQTIKLFLSPDVKVDAGAEITVTQHNKTSVFSCAGQPAIYATHQEVELKLERGWA